MSLMREVVYGLLKMFVADASLVIGILTVVSLTGVLTRYTAVSALFGGATLLVGCLIVLVISVLKASRSRGHWRLACEFPRNRRQVVHADVRSGHSTGS